MSLQSTETVEPSIVHLDFDPEVPDPEKEPEKPKTCELGRAHPHDPEVQPCGRLAVYLLSLKKPCGHVRDMYLCQGCWNEVENNPDKEWWCKKGVDNDKPCNAAYKVRPAIVRWEKL